ncbi:MAG: iron ABC transporter permease, partial [Polyangiaceae bacterium]|nr:iron ABC transporter permease [Polyangiaceae bacterium]
IFLANDAQLRTITFWNLGSVGGATWPLALAAAPALLPALALTHRLARPLDAMLLGEAEAGHLGFSVEATKRAAIVLVALAVGSSVAIAGSVWFVGLVVPHLARLLLGPGHRRLLPGAALLGGALVLLADLVARTVVAPAELPLGVVTGALGAPFFLLLLSREGRRLGA